MTKRDVEEIGAAIDRCMSGAVESKIIEHDSRVAVFGAFAGFKMWFDEYCAKNTEL